MHYNALIPIITIIVPMLAGILTGTLTIENIFGVPGLGDQFVRSITTNDFSVIMATTILFSTLFIVSIFIVDILYGVIDPEFVYKGQEIMVIKKMLQTLMAIFLMQRCHIQVMIFRIQILLLEI